jgi:hypothetical protein
MPSFKHAEFEIVEDDWFASHSVIALRNLLNCEMTSVLIAGKGPTLALIDKYLDPSEPIISLNHACELVLPRIAHFTDLQALLDCEEVVLASEFFVVVPAFPHISGAPTKLNILELASAHSIISELIVQDRLFVYAGSNSPNLWRLPEFELRYFSVEPAYQLACLLGARLVNTIGIDGGSSYATSISNQGKRRLLENGQQSFDKQFVQLEKLQLQHGIPLEPKIKPNTIYVGASRADLLPYLVLKHSIEHNSNSPVLVKPLPRVRRNPRRRKNRGRTAFSFSRFLIPELQKYEGRAVYLDSDMLVMDDISELFDYPIGENHLVVTSQSLPPQAWANSENFMPGPQFSVMIVECSKAKWRIGQIIDLLDSNAMSYSDLLHKMLIVPPEKIDYSLNPNWNSLEYYDPDKTKLLHFTVVPSQPWRTRDNANYDIWLEYLKSAIEAGVITSNTIRREIRIGSCGSHILRDLSPEFFLDHHASNEQSLHELEAIVGQKLLLIRIRATARNLLWRVKHSHNRKKAKIGTECRF